MGMVSMIDESGMPEGEKNGGNISKGWAESAPLPLIGIGLTQLPK